MKIKNKLMVTRGEGEGDDGERRRKGKQGNTNRGFMGVDNAGVGEVQKSPLTSKMF